jgi:GT2 family glycosyltransferase
MSAVAVVIINWNSWVLLARCLEALAAQTYKDFSVTIIDNASSEDMPLQLLAAYPQAKLVRNIANLGFAAGNNLAASKYTVNSEWIALINADAFAEPRWLEALLAATKANGAFDVFGSKLLNSANPTVLDGVGDIYHLSGRIWREGKGMLASEVTEIECEIFSPCAAAALYRRSAFCEVEGFDEDYFCYVEDVDLGFRLRLAGHRCLYVPQSVAHHVGSGTTGGQYSDFSVYHGHRNLVWTFVKNMPGVLFWLLLPIHLLLNLVSLIWFTLRGQGGVIFRSKRDALLGLPKMWRKRQIIQKNRVASISEIWRQLDKRLIPTKIFKNKT